MSSNQPAAPPKTPLNLLRPLLLLTYSAMYIFPTILDLLKTLNFQPFVNFSDFQEHWFARFWAFLGPQSRELSAPAVMPLLQHSASGVCLDIGPGSGLWLYLFARANNKDITRIIGVEPNIGMHKALRENAVKAGLGDIYEIVGCGAEELSSKGGIQPGSIDTIITVQCLCSIPTPQRVISELYPLLKPGGKWLVFEHVKTKYTDQFVEIWQRSINHIWPLFLNGCNLRRPTDEWLLQAGEWEEVNLRPAPGTGPYDTVPHIVGTLIKKRTK